MISKILFTAAVIGVVFFLLSRRNGPHSRVSAREREAAQRTECDRTARFAWPVAYAVIATMVISSGYFAYSKWQDGHRIVNIRVINASTGQSMTYQAHKGDVEERRFETLDGRVVTLAEVERMELGGRP